MIELTKYPKREDNSQPTFQLCKCGHHRLNHNINTDLAKPISGSCEKCQCPQWDLLGKFTAKEIDNIQKENQIC